MRRALITFAVCALALGVFPVRAEAQHASLEAQILALVNASRARSLAMHGGLSAAAREHSRAMAVRGGLTHSGAAQRIAGASPDPPDGSGPPDGGYTGTWCENTAFVSGAPRSEVPERIYRGWRQSPSHRRCMTDPAMTVAGVGLYYDGDTWWATMELMEDLTPPRSGGAQPRATAAAASAPTPSPAPAQPPSQETITRTPAATLAPLTAPAADATRAGATLGWPELFAAMGILAVTALAVRIIRLQRV